jgi:elongation factor P
MALNITDLKKGTLFQWENEPYRVVDYKQKVMGRGGSIVNVRIKSLIDVSNMTVQYLYHDDQTYFFMNEETFNQFEVTAEIVGDSAGYIKDGDKVQLQFFNDLPISLELPKNVPLLVTYTEAAVKGDTSTAITKEATLETGIRVRVPAFIKTGDFISIDTATGAYRERIKG